jgi:hypothetical protein
MRQKELQAITAPFGAHAELVSCDMQSNLGTVMTWQVHFQCPSLIVASDVYNALLVDAARPESLPKFALEYGRESPTPEPRPPPDPTVQ